MEATGESHGFTRNSNGKVWNEYVQDMLQCDEVRDSFSGDRRSSVHKLRVQRGQERGGQLLLRGLVRDRLAGREVPRQHASAVQWFVLPSSPPIPLSEPLIILQAGGAIDFFTGEKDPTAVVRNTQDSISNLTEVASSL